MRRETVNLIDFISASADYLVMDRPDLYNKDEAINELYSQISLLRETMDSEYATVSFSSYVMVRVFQDDCEEFLLARKLTGAFSVPDEGMTVYSFDRGIDLPYILDLDFDDLDEDQ